MNKFWGMLFVISFCFSSVFCEADISVKNLPHSVEENASVIVSLGKDLYSKVNKGVYRIHVIDMVSSKKASAGSAFFFRRDDILITNYHVVSQVVNYPDNYEIRWISPSGKEGIARLYAIDLIHDISILKCCDELHNEEGVFVFDARKEDISKGFKIFSLGNLFDRGVIIVDGLYNGIVENSWYNRFLFSGAINPGMSGGPAIDVNGNLIGINVATEGNNVSYIVPTKFLVELYENTVENDEYNPPSEGWLDVVEKQVAQYTHKIVERLLAIKEWPKTDFDIALLPADIDPALNVWTQNQDVRDSDAKQRIKVMKIYNNDYIFVVPDLLLGRLLIDYYLITSLGYHNAVQFYKATPINMLYSPWITDKHIAPPVCKSDFVDVNGVNCKLFFCMRPLREFKSLYELSFSLVSLDFPKQILNSDINISGITKEDAIRLVERFLKEITWKR